MKHWIGWTVLATLVVALVTNVVVVIAMPYRIMDKTMGERFGSVPRNTVIHGQLKTADDRSVVRPSPDLLYSIILYDVSQNPLHITATVPESYWSVSFFASNSDNFFVLNNEQAESNTVKLLLVGKNKAWSNQNNAKVIVAPSERGIVLFRLFITDVKDLPELVKIQKQAFCREVGVSGEQQPAQVLPSAETALYRNADYGFSIEYPKSWIKKEPKGSQVLYAASPERVPVITVSIRGEATFADAITSALKEAGNTDINVGAETQVTLPDSATATQTKLTFKLAAGYPAEALSLGVQKKGKWVLVTVTTVSLLVPYDEAAFSNIAHTLRFE